MANLKNRPRFAVSERADQRIALTSADGSRIELFVLADDIIRVLVLPHGELRGPRTWSIAPGQEDVPLEGRDRYDIGGFAPAPFTLSGDADHVAIETSQIRLTVALDGGFCSWDIRRAGRWHNVMN